MKYAFISVLCAISTLSVEGFLPSSPSKESLSSLKLFKSTKSKFTPEDVAVDEFIIAMLKASKFVYLFRNVRDVVRDHDDSVGVADRSAEEAKRGFFSRPIKKVKFNRPELIITDKGAQKVVENRFLKYPITAAAMKEFFNLNRRFFTEDSKGDLSIDDNEKPPAYEFKFEKGLGFDEGIQDGLELIDYVSEIESRAFCFLTRMKLFTVMCYIYCINFFNFDCSLLLSSLGRRVHNGQRWNHLWSIGEPCRQICLPCVPRYGRSWRYYD